MAKKRKAVERVEHDGRFYATDGMYRWPIGPPQPPKKTSLAEQQPRPQEILTWFSLSWQERLAEIRAWLLEITAPHLVGPLADDDDYWWQDEREGSEEWGHEIKGRMRWRRVIQDEIVIIGSQSFRLLNPDGIPGWAHEAIGTFCTLDTLAEDLKTGTNLDAILRGAIEVGRMVESVEKREAFAPLVLSESGRRAGARKSIEVVNELHAELRPQYQTEVDRRIAGGDSYSAACDHVAAALGVSSRTVNTHTNNPAPRNRGRRR